MGVPRCDTSFVLTRNGHTVQVGVIAKALQSSQGVFLPSFDLDLAADGNHSASEIRRMIQSALQTHPKQVSQVIAKDLRSRQSQTGDSPIGASN